MAELSQGRRSQLMASIIVKITVPGTTHLTPNDVQYVFDAYTGDFFERTLVLSMMNGAKVEEYVDAADPFGTLDWSILTPKDMK
jgi:hypothetical protein